MALLIHVGISEIESRINKIIEPRLRLLTGPNELLDRTVKVRTNFRKRIRSVADTKIELKSSSNGEESFNAWLAGFEYARKIPDDVHYFIFPNSNSFAVIHSTDCLKKVDHVIAEFSHKVAELENICAVSDVMLS